MFHAYAARFNVTKNLKFFWKNKASTQEEDKGL